MKKIIAILLLIGVSGFLFWSLTNVGATQKADYIGTEKCKMCHMKQYKTWEKMPHSTTFSRLKDEDVKNPKCLKCHTTGYGKGGYKDAATTPNLKDVGCEACHGPGSLHMKAKKEDRKKTINRILKNVCVECHNPHIRDRATYYKTVR
ncbi:MAG: cytochrome c family protein [bacterium]|nr:cytochrome c family protein [bacterium]